MVTVPDSPSSSSPDSKGLSAPSRAPLVALVVALAVPGAVSALWLAPRPAVPAEMPPLVVPAQQAAASLAAIARSAEQAPSPDATEQRRRTLYLAHGVTEARRRGSPDEARSRDAELTQLAATQAEAGALDAVRARDVERSVQALRAQGEGDARLGEIGALPTALARYGAVIGDRRVAPIVVVEALAWARWNAIHRRTLTEGMDATLLHAYHGWLVYYGPSQGTELRDDALVELVRAGGRRGLETEGFLRLSRNDAHGAQLAFEAAYEASGNVRLRNHALALGLATLEGTHGDD